MANQRKKTKKKLQVWLEDSDLAKLPKLAARHGYDNVTAFLTAVANGEVVTQSPSSPKRGAKGK